MTLFKPSNVLKYFKEDATALSVSSCGCYMTNASCGGSTDFGTGSSAAQACGQSSLSQNSPIHASCP